MKLNRYTYIVPFDDDQQIIFNGVTCNFIIIRNEAVPSYRAIMQNPDDYAESHPTIVKELEHRGFVVEDNADPKKCLICRRYNFIEDPSFKAVILPTFECNYNCWYCIQKHTPVKLDMSKLELIVKHNKKYLLENKIEEYILSWFGGEPLTQPEIVGRISSEMRDFCKEHGIKFKGAITSNGALLTPDVIEMLRDSEIMYYQIAVDGDEQAHNRVKHDARSDSSFALVLSNICELARKIKGATIVLRVNYTIEMLRSKRVVADVLKYIPAELRSCIQVDLQKVWQVREEMVSFDDLIWLQNEFASNGFKLVTSHIFNMCYVEKRHYNMFYYNGSVEKCDQRSMENLRGYINEDGDVVWKENPLFPMYDLFASDCVCSDCDYYPLCFCGCPVQREDQIKQSHDKKIQCGYDGSYYIFEKRIRDYCWRVYHNLKYDLQSEM